jgi:Predicted membrane protein
MEKRTSHLGVGGMVRLAALVAIIVLMAFTPLGYFKYGALSITFIMIPVVIGAIVLGPGAGAILGGVFGLTSLIQCFGLDAFGTTLFGINPVATIIMCLVPRILMGWLSGLIFRALYRIDRTKIVSYAAASLSGAVINTVLFVGALLIFFGNTAFLRSFGSSLLQIIGVLITINALIEAIVCLIAGAAISKALQHFLPVDRTKK